jgi:thiol-disulfide isomerase/thioredoxin
MKSVEEYKCYQITFIKSFKFPNQSDTIFEKYNSTLNLNDKNDLGWHSVVWLKSKSDKGLAAFNPIKISRVNYVDNFYYSTLKSENEKLFQGQKEQYLYAPFYRSKEEWSKFEFMSEDKEFYYLIHKDSIKNPQNNILLYYNETTVAVSKETYLPMLESAISSKGKTVQFSEYKLVFVKNLNSNGSFVNSQTDSVFNVIHSYLDADSVKQAKANLYKEIKIGDSVDYFLANDSKGNAFDFKDVKDSIILLDFFYTTCKPCQYSIPELNQVFDSFKNKGVLVVGLNAMNSDWSNLAAYIERQQIHYPILKISKEVVYNYNVKFFPRLFVIKNGKLVKIYFGYNKSYASDIRNLLQTLTQ